LTDQGVLELREITKNYGKITAVDSLSLDFFPGEILGLLGPNGAGKTTTINLVAGLLSPDKGEILLDGIPVAEYDYDYRSRIGVCPQENVHWKRLTPIEQLGFLGRMYGLKRDQIRKRSQLLLEEMGLGEVSKRQAGKLSGGMQRRLNIALALIHNPEILILDEPEAGLDPQSRIKVREYIRMLAVDKTIILTTHNMDEAYRMADRVAIIDYGKLLVIDDPEALLSKVGEGDVLEIEIIGEGLQGDSHDLNFPNQVQSLVLGDIVQIRGLDLVNSLPEILSHIERINLQAGEIRLRKNTLEDVFIQLTGRRLRD
jgi:ABC-2 type transport system ATP-binding protein